MSPTNTLLASREDPFGSDGERNVVALVLALVLVERNIAASGAMGSTANTAT